MIERELCMAMDCKRDNSKPMEIFSYQQEGKWFICSRGPTYCNIFRVTGYDQTGEEILHKRERRPDGTFLTEGPSNG